MPESPKPFAQWLDATMQSRGLSQAAVAREVGVADAQVSRWRRGQVTPSVRYLQRIAETFDVPRARLDHMAGYPGAEGSSGKSDPETEAEIQAYQARYRDVIERTVPRSLWRAYAEACEALAQELGASFRETLRRVEGEAVPGRPERHIGFHTREQPEGGQHD